MTDRFSRQSFLGEDAEERIGRCIVGVVGLGGGGSHIIQQLAHVGFQQYVLFDDDVVEDSNLNRLVGARAVDALAETPKLHVAKTVIYGLQPKATIRGHFGKWQTNPRLLRECHIVFGCVDGYRQRHELEVACRRHLCHYIDIGMDVHGTSARSISGQVILSAPGGPCMRCMGFLNDDVLAKEAARYGNAGIRPQVVWSNGILASVAVGIAVDLVTNWTGLRRHYEYLVLDGNKPSLTASYTLRNLNPDGCRHFPAADVGPPVATVL